MGLSAGEALFKTVLNRSFQEKNAGLACTSCHINASSTTAAFQIRRPGERLIINEDVGHKCNYKCSGSQTQASKQVHNMCIYSLYFIL